jgi:hypothetical protein
MPRRFTRRPVVPTHAQALRDNADALRVQTADLIANTKRIMASTSTIKDEIRRRKGPPEPPSASTPMTSRRLPFAEIRRMIGAPQIQVEANGRMWRLHLVDGHHDSVAVELLFEHVHAGLPAVRLRVKESDLDRDHVAALLRLHLT